MKKRLTLQDVIELIRGEAEKTGSQKELAKKLGVSAQYISDILNGRREPGDAILKPLGLHKVVTYEQE
jgi:transcriptional regulator with XRE-family HTH domain